MPTLKLPIDPDGTPRIEIRWRGLYKEVEVSFDGQRIGVIPDSKALKTGQTFSLADGSSLEVRLSTGMTTELLVLRNGEPVPGSASHPAARIKTAWAMVLLVAALNVLLGLASLVFDAGWLRALGSPIGLIGAGLVYAVLGAWVRAKRSVIALGLAVGLFMADGLAILLTWSGPNPPIAGLVARVFFVLPMLQGFGAIRRMRAAERPAKLA